jgi:glycosyltransferase involved in cell wall biosynthesis
MMRVMKDLTLDIGCGERKKEGAIEVVKKEYNWYNITENLVSIYRKLT